MKTTNLIRRHTVYRIKLNPSPGLAVLGGKSVCMNPVAAPPHWNAEYRLRHKRATWRRDPNRNRTRAGQFNKISRVTKIRMIKDRLDAWVSMSSGALDMSLFIDTTIPNTHNS